MWLKINGLDLYAKGAVVVNATGFIIVPKMNITSNYTDIKLDVEPMLGTGSHGEIIDNLLNVIGINIWDQVRQFLD